MKTVFDTEARDELIRRVNSLTEANTAQWGKMNLYQMLKHCTLWDTMVHSSKRDKQAFIGRLFGKMALKSFLKEGRPVPKGIGTLSSLIVTENGEAGQQKAQWISLLEKYTHFSNPHFVHPFFGKMSQEHIGQMAYKHADHHLRQFNA